MASPNHSTIYVLHQQQSLLVDNAVAYEPLVGDFTSLRHDLSSLRDVIGSLDSTLEDGLRSLEDEMLCMPMRITNYLLTSTHAAIFWPNGTILPPGSPTTKNEITHASAPTLRAVLQALGQYVASDAGRQVMQNTLCNYLGVRMEEKDNLHTTSSYPVGGFLKSHL